LSEPLLWLPRCSFLLHPTPKAFPVASSGVREMVKERLVLLEQLLGA
jgi:hypothetical protein